MRVGADQSDGGGSWNGPVNSGTGQFASVAIPESSPVRPGLNKPYANLGRPLADLATSLPPPQSVRDMHLDPDFEYLTYGDQGERAKQIRAKVGPGDLLVFYAGMRAVQPSAQLVYALIGLYVVNDIIPALSVPAWRRHENAHTRRVLAAGASDIVVRAHRNLSGRMGRLSEVIPRLNQAVSNDTLATLCDTLRPKLPSWRLKPAAQVRIQDLSQIPYE